MKFETEHTFIKKCRIWGIRLGEVVSAIKACYEERERYILLYGVSPEYVCIGNGMVYLFFDPYFNSSPESKIRTIICSYSICGHPGYRAFADFITYSGGSESSSAHLLCITHETALNLMDQFPT